MITTQLAIFYHPEQAIPREAVDGSPGTPIDEPKELHHDRAK